MTTISGDPQATTPGVPSILNGGDRSLTDAERALVERLDRAEGPIDGMQLGRLHAIARQLPVGSADRLLVEGLLQGTPVSPASAPERERLEQRRDELASRLSPEGQRAARLQYPETMERALARAITNADRSVSEYDARHRARAQLDERAKRDEEMAREEYATVKQRLDALEAS